MITGEPVIVRNVRPARTNNRVLQVEFYQEIARPITDKGALLNLLMEGHEAFGPLSRTRVVYQNMCIDAYNKFGLDIGVAFPEKWGAEIVVHEFCVGDRIPERVRSYYDYLNDYYGTSEFFNPATWLGWVEGEPIRCFQQPKKTPKEKIVLTRDGSPIYRCTFLTVRTMDQNDYLIKHDDIHHQGAFTSNLNEKITVSKVGNAINT